MNIYVKTGMLVICLGISFIVVQNLLVLSTDAFGLLTSLGEELNKLP